MSIFGYYQAIRKLKLEQVWWQFKYRFWRRFFPISKCRAPARLLWQTPLPKKAPFIWMPGGARVDVKRKTYEFLNQRVIFGEEVDWGASGLPRLWGYNLNYFDFLSVTDAETGKETIFDWIARCHEGIGWESAPTSCRIINWIKFIDEKLVDQSEDESLRQILASLHIQTDWLSRSLERHINGNHLLKNAVALIFAGVFLCNRRFLLTGCDLLHEAVAEQFLADGAHYERSPMYHAMAMVDILDCLNLDLEDASLQHLLRQVAERGLGYLLAMTHPDGEIALFNDSVFNVAPQPRVILGYAERVARIRSKRPPDTTAGAFADAGYFVLPTSLYRMVVDAGPLGPDYLPAHGHCDLLSFELCVGDRRAIVDSGNFDYEASKIRAYCRSTRAHNTLTVDDQDQSDMGGVFRVGRRARPIEAHLAEQNGRHIFVASHDGYLTRNIKTRHQRTIIAFQEDFYLIIDSLTGVGEHRVKSYLHFHPDCDLTAGPSRQTINIGCHRFAVRSCLAGVEAALESGWYCPEFGVCREQKVLVFSVHGTLPLLVAYCLGALPEGRVYLDLRQSTLVIGDRRWSWKMPEGTQLCVF